MVDFTVALKSTCHSHTLRNTLCLPHTQVADIAWALAAFAHLPTPEWMETLEVIIITRYKERERDRQTQSEVEREDVDRSARVLRHTYNSLLGGQTTNGPVSA